MFVRRGPGGHTCASPPIFFSLRKLTPLFAKRILRQLLVPIHARDCGRLALFVQLWMGKKKGG